MRHFSGGTSETGSEPERGFAALEKARATRESNSESTDPENWKIGTEISPSFGGGVIDKISPVAAGDCGVQRKRLMKVGENMSGIVSKGYSWEQKW